MNLVQKVKTRVQEKPVTYLAATAVVGVVAGFLVSRNYMVSAKVVNTLLNDKPDKAEILNNYLADMEAVGFHLIALNPVQDKQYLAALNSIRLEAA